MHSGFWTTTTIFTLFSASLADTISGGLTGNGVSAQNFGAGASCQYNNLNGYCCDGSIIGDISDLSNAICCLGDPNMNIDNTSGSVTCTAGTPVPLTAAGSSGTHSATFGIQTSTSANNDQTITGGGGTTISNNVYVSDGSTITTGTTITGGGTAAATTAAATDSASSATSSSASSSTGGAMGAAITVAPVLGGALMVGAFAVL